jgi:uncharacterized protein
MKALLEEPGSADTRDLVEAADDLSTSRLTYVEARAALARARRGSRFTADEIQCAADELDEHWATFNIVEVDEALVILASAAAEAFALRAYDAVQLASALTLNTDDLVFLSWDRPLRAAATRAGLSAEPR